MAYTKTSWANGDTITAEKLNHAEQGIKDNDTAIVTTASISNGVISFKNNAGTTQFSVTLPVYDGGVD